MRKIFTKTLAEIMEENQRLQKIVSPTEKLAAILKQAEALREHVDELEALEAEWGNPAYASRQSSAAFRSVSKEYDSPNAQPSDRLSKMSPSELADEAVRLGRTR